MRILKVGKTPECGRPYRGSCARCGCEVECFGNEVLPGVGWFFRRFWWVFCPTDWCLNRIEVKPVEVKV
jgi:hypothetical protein